MRLLKVLFTALFALIALVAGLFVAAVVALSSVALFATRRFNGERSPARAGPRSPSRAKTVAPGDVIDVSATEVPADRLRS